MASATVGVSPRMRPSWRRLQQVGITRGGVPLSAVVPTLNGEGLASPGAVAVENRLDGLFVRLVYDLASR